MCACDDRFTCARCAGTHRDDRYPELSDDGEPVTADKRRGTITDVTEIPA